MHRVQACQRIVKDLEIQSSKAEELQFSVDYMTTENYLSKIDYTTKSLK